jgi:hypothetical protein
MGDARELARATSQGAPGPQPIPRVVPAALNICSSRSIIRGRARYVGQPSSCAASLDLVRRANGAALPTAAPCKVIFHVRGRDANAYFAGGGMRSKFGMSVAVKSQPGRSLT